MGRLDGKVAVVTGAASGIGREVARRFAAEDAAVVAFDLNEDDLRRLADELGDRVLIHPGDVRTADDLSAAVRRAEQEFGLLTTICNCAGVYDNVPFLELTEERWRRTVDINLSGVYFACKAAVPAMQRAGGGSIINLASANSMVASPGETAYSASKGGVLMLTKAIAVEHARDAIRANAICPGFVDTPMVAGTIAQFGDRDQMLTEVSKFQPLGIGLPEDIARVACFLASDDSRSMTGSAVMADGGYTAM
ncbi:SDR family NAD(P)-dependent oxidoreductase [Mycolicibacterium tokaiense]|uniref:Dehydrogenase n=1 Tax=Mycolicibacterium tokaiense TaxID=39695 RepID=A0A378TCK6_9MYCO|nr:SDR family NAD(P)-dependent oxidoreductase [Mycolicibacterium tokaiense]BBY86944.1 oxidoreductase UcpA [Mycolicibacterium tokaiense]STZ58551.1 dehydrogenase [Mycolicibacterium tokaiense]